MAGSAWQDREAATSAPMPGAEQAKGAGSGQPGPTAAGATDAGERDAQEAQESDSDGAATDGTTQDTRQELLENFEEVFQLTEWWGWRRWDEHREAVSGLWQVFMLQRCGWRPTSKGGNGRPFPLTMWRHIATYFDPELYALPSRMPSSALDTMRHILLGELKRGPRLVNDGRTRSRNSWQKVRAQRAALRAARGGRQAEEEGKPADKVGEAPTS
mmetsp:Transcript_67116/g.216498  ORF Transcript_67116/g.216498 Transcript_67116/m.216498 type:complete len:215 (+) Transcript_67116:110-754(+)